MKKILYNLCIGAAILGFSSCSGHEEYDAYINELNAQPEIIDTISSPESYGKYLDRLATMANDFEQLGLKLDDAQKDSITALSEEIQFRLTDKYNALANTPSVLPDDIEIIESTDQPDPFIITDVNPQ